MPIELDPNEDWLEHSKWNVPKGAFSRRFVVTQLVLMW